MHYSIAFASALLAVAVAAPLPEVVYVTDNEVVTKYAEATVTAEATQYQTAPVVIVTETANSQNVVQIVTEIFTQTAGYGYNAPAPAAPTSVSFEQVSTSAKAAAAAPTTSKIVVVTSSAAPAPAAPATTSSAVQVQAAPAAGWTSTYFSAWTSTWEIAPSSTSAAAPASTSAAAASPVSVSSYAQKILDAHNQYRAKHSAGALTWNTDMENFASTVSGKCVFEHSGGKYGENLAAGYDEDTAAVKAWYDENTQYNYSAGQFTEETGHFTQLVWKDAKQVGCATVSCDGKDNTPGKMLTCEYDTGNVIGYFIQNVLPATS